MEERMGVQLVDQMLVSASAAPWANVNGGLIPISDSKVSVFDRSFMYGDSVYTSLRVENSIPLFLRRHIDRLYDHTSRLLFGPLSLGFDLSDMVRSLIAANSLSSGYIRITISRGTILKLPSLKAIDPLVVAIAQPIPVDFMPGAVDAITIADSRDGFRDIKTANRLPALFAVRQALLAGASEALLTDGTEIVEATCHNVFGWEAGMLITPSVHGRGLAGIMRQVLIDNFPCSIGNIHSTFKGPLFLTNCLVGVVPVRKLDGILLEQDANALLALRRVISNAQLCEMS